MDCGHSPLFQIKKLSYNSLFTEPRLHDQLKGQRKGFKLRELRGRTSFLVNAQLQKVICFALGRNKTGSSRCSKGQFCVDQENPVEVVFLTHLVSNKVNDISL